MKARKPTLTAVKATPPTPPSPEMNEAALKMLAHLVASGEDSEGCILDAVLDNLAGDVYVLMQAVTSETYDVDVHERLEPIYFRLRGLKQLIDFDRARERERLLASRNGT